jgi:hypothetical protein
MPLARKESVMEGHSRNPLRLSFVAFRVGLVLSVNLVGCHHANRPCALPPTMTAHCSPNLVANPVRRVALLPVDNQTEYPAAGSRFSAILASELYSARLFELVRLDACDPHLLPGDAQLRKGRFPEPLLAELRRDYHVDGVLFASLQELRPYWPPRFAASLHLADTRTAEMLASVEGAWDASDDHVTYQTRQFFRQTSFRESLGDEDLVLQSPELMGKFVARQLVSQLAGCVGNCGTELSDDEGSSRSEPLEPTPGSVPVSPPAPVVRSPEIHLEELPPPAGS